MRPSRHLWGIWLACAAVCSASPAQADDDTLANQAFGVLKQYCYRCHGVTRKVPGLDVLNRESLIRTHGDQDASFAYVSPGRIEQSRLWDRAGESRDMPPSGPKPSTEELSVLRRWIEAGALFPRRAAREFLSERTILTAVRDHLAQASESDRPHLRYFTLHHLANNYVQVGEFDLRLYRAALAKVLNSLSWNRDLVAVSAVPGTQDTAYAVDLRQLRTIDQKPWGFRQWLEIVRQYPYGLKYDDAEDAGLRKAARDVQMLSPEALLLTLRADWFVVNAMQGSLYTQLLGLPATAGDLEKRLGVNVAAAMQSGTFPQIARSGFAASGVSKQNRLVERHTAPFGYYWKSYDFKPRKAKGDLVRFPLGPKVAGQAFANLAFEHDGGELIFSLPNGMQGYMLVKADDSRLDEPGPIDVVFDAAAISGTPAIVNGISCMNCHRRGMIRNLVDEIRPSGSTGGKAREAVERLYPPEERMESLLAGDEARFLESLARVAGPFLKVGDDAQKPIGDHPEPVGKVAELYLADLGLTEVALELGLESAERLRDKIRDNRELLKLGLGTLAGENAARIKREKWEARAGTSLFHEAAIELRLGGTPVVP